jgi:DNA polymerase-1
MISSKMISGPFCKVEFQPTNLNSPEQMKAFLLTQGWKPTTFTEKGSPQLTEDSYDSIKGELGQLIAKRAVLKHRAQMIFNITKQGELKGFLNIMRSDGRVEAGAITNATNTGRMAHRGLVNVPKPKDKDLWPSNIQLRELFIVPDDKLMMGADADGLEARMEAHACKPYPGGEEYAEDLIEGDVHSSTAYKNGDMSEEEYAFFYRHKVEEIPIPDEDKEEYDRLEGVRDSWKSPRYGLSYGAQPFKVNIILGVEHPRGCKKDIDVKNSCDRCSRSTRGRCRGAEVFDGFWRANTALKGFKDRITKFWKTKGGKKYIIGIDGRKIWIRSEHSIVNAYFQSTGSITVKVAALFLDKWCRQKGLKSQQIIIYHDEVEYEVYPEEKEILEELTKRAFVKAGEYLGIRVPVTGSPKWGMNWKQVH